MVLDKIADAAMSIISPVIQSVFPNPEDKLKATELEAKIRLAVLENGGKLMEACKQVVMAEIVQGSVLARNWRPAMMLLFGFLIAAYMFGWTDPDIPVEIVASLFVLVQIGIGGYIGCRTAEKLLPGLIEKTINALGQKKQQAWEKYVPPTKEWQNPDDPK